jgi:hypothetical protein
MLFPHLSGPAFTGQGCWRAVVSRPADVTATWVYCAQYAKAGSSPISQDLMYLYLLDRRRAIRGLTRPTGCLCSNKGWRGLAAIFPRLWRSWMKAR